MSLNGYESLQIKESKNYSAKSCAGLLVIATFTVLVWMVTYKENNPEPTKPPTFYYDDPERTPPPSLLTTKKPTPAPTELYTELGETLQTNIQIKPGMLQILGLETNQFADPIMYSSAITSDIDACQSKCFNNAECSAFQFRIDTNVCNTFDQGVMPNLIFNDDLGGVVSSAFVPLIDDNGVTFKSIDPSQCSSIGYSSVTQLDNVNVCIRMCQNGAGTCIGYVYDNTNCYLFTNTYPQAFTFLGDNAYCGIITSEIKAPTDSFQEIKPAYSQPHWIVQGDLYNYARTGLKGLRYTIVDYHQCFQYCIQNTLGVCRGFTASTTNNDCYLNAGSGDPTLIIGEAVTTEEDPSAAEFTVLFNAFGTDTFDWEFVSYGGLPIFDFDDLYTNVTTYGLTNCLGYCSYNDVAYIVAYDDETNSCYCYQKSYNVAITSNTTFETGNINLNVYKRNVEKNFVQVPFQFNFIAEDADTIFEQDENPDCQNSPDFDEENSYDFISSERAVAAFNGCYLQTANTERRHTIVNSSNNLFGAEGYTLKTSTSTSNKFENINPNDGFPYRCTYESSAFNSLDSTSISIHVQATQVYQSPDNSLENPATCFDICQRNILCRAVELVNFRGSLTCAYIFANITKGNGAITGTTPPTDSIGGTTGNCYVKVNEININVV